MSGRRKLGAAACAENGIVLSHDPQNSGPGKIRSRKESRISQLPVAKRLDHALNIGFNHISPSIHLKVCRPSRREVGTTRSSRRASFRCFKSLQPNPIGGFFARRDQLVGCVRCHVDIERGKRLVVDIDPACDHHSAVDALRGPRPVRVDADTPKEPFYAGKCDADQLSCAQLRGAPYDGGKHRAQNPGEIAFFRMTGANGTRCKSGKLPHVGCFGRWRTL